MSSRGFLDLQNTPPPPSFALVLCFSPLPLSFGIHYAWGSSLFLSHFLGFLVVISFPFLFSRHFLLSHQFTLKVLDDSSCTAPHGIRIPHCRYHITHLFFVRPLLRFIVSCPQHSVSLPSFPLHHRSLFSPLFSLLFSDVVLHLYAWPVYVLLSSITNNSTVRRRYHQP